MTTPVKTAGARTPARAVGTPTPTPNRPWRIRGLDGLRAVSVAAVLAFHLWPNVIPGGFLGVDVFFVISGYLITTLLLREIRSEGAIDLGGFWVRRARRLLPLVVLVTVSAVAAARLVDEELLVGVRSQVIGALTFSSNWISVIEGGDYFDHRTPSMFTTFWSLAVEEQFYLFWPLIFTAIHRRPVRARTMTRAAIGVAVVSAVWMGWLVRGGSSISRAYWGTDSHMSGLMLGVSLAYGSFGGIRLLRSRRWGRIRVWLPFVATVALALLIVFVDGESTGAYPFALLGASVAAGAVVVSLRGRPTTFVRLCENPVLEWLGTRSFGIYLWHWPVLTVLRQTMMPGAPTADASLTVAALTLLFTFGLSELSFRYLETPVRRYGFGGCFAAVRDALGGPYPLVPRGFVAGGVLLVALAGFGVWSAPTTSGAEASVEAGLAAIEAAQRAAATSTTTTVPPAPVDPAVGEVVTTAPTTTAPPLAWTGEVPPGELIDGFGDSVMSGAAPALYERFPGIRLDAKPIRQWDDGLEVIRAAEQRGDLREVVVLNFGTNAGLKDEAHQRNFRDILDLLGPERRVVVFDIVGVSHWVDSSNRTLREIASDYPNVIVADWNKVVHTFPGLLHSDRTHPNMKGIAAYAELLSQTLAKLGPGD